MMQHVDSDTHFWYRNANGNMSDYQTATSTSFGSGKQNTKNMIAKWNSSAYGAQNDNSSYDDMWGLSTVQSKINANPAWYVPSKEEWSAFGSQLGITSSNYGNKGLSYLCWSSSQDDTSNAWLANFYSGYMASLRVNGDNYVRLGATF